MVQKRSNVNSITTEEQKQIKKRRNNENIQESIIKKSRDIRERQKIMRIINLLEYHRTQIWEDIRKTEIAARILIWLGFIITDINDEDFIKEFRKIKNKGKVKSKLRNWLYEEYKIQRTNKEKQEIIIEEIGTNKFMIKIIDEDTIVDKEINQINTALILLDMKLIGKKARRLVNLRFNRYDVIVEGFMNKAEGF
ncbi:hypothetical protein RCL_jg11368.t1 [Rhizophagus clarus]|uniref:Uncharacterized protein n=1 Tax=Rhizophagus clarus TaxID=94130 RepID=A0A8H3QPU8_9GLOM|nr:hypothetical protein RCL_jg11368.t1 [Rhizophagus clarus]